MATKSEQGAYLYRMKEACQVARMKKAKFNEAVVTAQGALESSWGTSELAKKANNLFGIKTGSTWDGPTLDYYTWEYGPSGWYLTIARWRKYLSWNLCIVDYSNILQSLPWFRDALQHLDNADLFLKSLLPAPGEPGWATDPRYFDKVKTIGKQIEAMGGPRWK